MSSTAHTTGPLSKEFLLRTIRAQDLFLESADDGPLAEWTLRVSAVGLDAAGGRRSLATEMGVAVVRLHTGNGVQTGNGPEPFWIRGHCCS